LNNDIKESPMPRLTVNHHIPGAKVNAATFSFKNLLVASGGDDGKVVLQTSANGAAITSFDAYQKQVINPFT
jgi:hypothetical protein